MARRKRIGFMVLLLAMALGASQALPAAAATRFGSRLTTDTQPSNAGQGRWCEEFTQDDDQPPHPNCTWVMMEAYGRPVSNPGPDHRAPRKGYIDKVRVVACAPGSFRLQIAKVRPALQQARIVRNGPIVNYNGDPDNCDDETYTINTINIPNVRVFKNEYLAVKARKVGFLRCSSGGPNMLLFDPPLPVGAGYRTATEDDGCWLLLEAVMTS
jgi:hypothetical protein